MLPADSGWKLQIAGLQPNRPTVAQPARNQVSGLTQALLEA